ncbi:MAG: methylmalonyl-CoA epimerase [Acidobacteria bacterium]|nr:methylmalonyl-CoA epimerase [Acidobacteriota bacterium]
MINKIDHLGIAVASLEEAGRVYRDMGFAYCGNEAVTEQGVNVSFFEVGESHIELLEPLGEDSPIAKFLAKRGPGIHHICVEVDDIDEALTRYREAGVTLINKQPVLGAGGCRVAFVHPKSTFGVLLELKEKAR